MAKGKCKCKSAECEECPEWIFTFADLVMLMMGFFVILWVLKPPAGKEGEPHRDLPVDVVANIRIAFGYKPDPKSVDPIDQAALRILRMPHSPTDGGKTSNEVQGKRGTEPEVQNVRPSKQVGMGLKVIFEPGSVELTAESKRSLDEIANMIRGVKFIYMVKGHAAADDYAEGANEELKMKLSLQRAEAAAEYLASRGVARDTLRVQGCSTYEPLIARPYSNDDRSQNRRVEVVASETAVKELQGGKEKPIRSQGSEKGEHSK